MEKLGKMSLIQKWKCNLLTFVSLIKIKMIPCFILLLIMYIFQEFFFKYLRIHLL